jgi:hypothetical protein
MSHDKIRDAARRRMAATGESYSTARRRVVAEQSALSAEDVRAAAAAHEELGAEYSDAAVASFLEKVEQEIGARVEARLATSRVPEMAKIPIAAVRCSKASPSASGSAWSLPSRSAATPTRGCTGWSSSCSFSR